jgi:hypothetical protein
MSWGYISFHDCCFCKKPVTVQFVTFFTHLRFLQGWEPKPSEPKYHITALAMQHHWLLRCIDHTVHVTSTVPVTKNYSHLTAAKRSLFQRLLVRSSSSSNFKCAAINLNLNKFEILSKFGWEKDTAFYIIHLFN